MSLEQLQIQLLIILLECKLGCTAFKHWQQAGADRFLGGCASSYTVLSGPGHAARAANGTQRSYQAVKGTRKAPKAANGIEKGTERLRKGTEIKWEGNRRKELAGNDVS